MYLPACLINQIGVKGADSRRHARMNGLLRRDSVNLGFAVTLKLDTSALTSNRRTFPKSRTFNSGATPAIIKKSPPLPQKRAITANMGD